MTGLSPDARFHLLVADAVKRIQGLSPQLKADVALPLVDQCATVLVGALLDIRREREAGRPEPDWMFSLSVYVFGRHLNSLMRNGCGHDLIGRFPGVTERQLYDALIPLVIDILDNPL